VTSATAAIESTAGARDYVLAETRSMLARLDRVQSLLVVDTASPAAAIPIATIRLIEGRLAGDRRRMRTRLRTFEQRLLDRATGTPESWQASLAILRVRFTTLLGDHDLFLDVLTQRSEHFNGVWLSGLDVAAADALRVPRLDVEWPDLVVYLDRGAGAAIRRARTRLPGGSENPVAIVRIPRERMIGGGIASSLAHEVGHQAVHVIGVLDVLQRAARRRCDRAATPAGRQVWSAWRRWMSEIAADLWMVGRVGVGGANGLMTVLTLPSPFVHRITLQDPHPPPWVRLHLAAAMGDAIFPDPQWNGLRERWHQLYPVRTARQSPLLTMLSEASSECAHTLVAQVPRRGDGRPLRALLREVTPAPRQLRAWRPDAPTAARMLASLGPVRAFATIGQARADGRLGAEREVVLVDGLLRRWALARALGSRVNDSSP
jgi:hypothetical protein